jgi:hypothetical protein
MLYDLNANKYTQSNRKFIRYQRMTATGGSGTGRHSMITTLDVRMSCDTFWEYSFNIPIRIDEFYNAKDNNINMNRYNRDVHRSNTCEIGNIGRSDPRFLRLEEYLVEYVIQHIYDDLVQKHQHRDIPILLKKARKFHIHGRTLEDLLFPASSSNDHMTPENIVYICTHC